MTPTNPQDHRDSELEPCPFCGSTNTDPSGWASHNPVTGEVREGPTCDDCGASAESVEAWNRRAALRQPEAVGRVVITDPAECERFNLRPSPETVRQIRDLEEAQAASAHQARNLLVGASSPEAVGEVERIVAAGEKMAHRTGGRFVIDPEKLARFPSAVRPPVDQGEWRPIESAPKDGTVFLGCNLDHPSFGRWPMHRRVRHAFNDNGEAFTTDLGGWVIIHDLSPDYHGGASVGPEPDFAIAQDELNRSVRYGWMPLPPAPKKEEGN